MSAQPGGVDAAVNVHGGPVVTAPHAPDQYLVVHTVEPDSATARALPFLASWAASEAR
jgi:hypothetical protein